MTPTRTEVEARIESVLDPCSEALGRPVGLVSMGLVRDVRIESIDGGACVSVTLTTTDPLCMMAPAFLHAVGRMVGEMPGVVDVNVDLEHAIWTEDDLAAGARRSLTQLRRRRFGDRTAVPWLTPPSAEASR